MIEPVAQQWSRLWSLLPGAEVNLTGGWGQQRVTRVVITHGVGWWSKHWPTLQD